MITIKVKDKDLKNNLMQTKDLKYLKNNDAINMIRLLLDNYLKNDSDYEISIKRKSLNIENNNIQKNYRKYYKEYYDINFDNKYDIHYDVLYPNIHNIHLDEEID